VLAAWLSYTVGAMTAFSGARDWVVRHQRGIREWLVLVAAVVAGVAGWQQIADERDARKTSEEHATVAERRSQAEQVSAWLAYERIAGADVVFANRSDQPIYQAVVSSLAETSGGLEVPRGHRAFMVVPPGEFKTTFAFKFPTSRNFPPIEIAFKDASGVNWIRSASGTLNEIPVDPASYYHLSSPAWGFPGALR
jgi:hypothetical protein